MERNYLDKNFQKERYNYVDHKNSGVSKGDVWIFPPQADDLALTGNDF